MFHFYNGAPKEFATGKKVKDRSRTSMDGLKVQNLTEMKGGTGARQDQISAAPVAGAETRSATACSGPIPGIVTPVPIQVSGRMLRLRNNRSEYPGLNFFQIETQITDGSFFNF